MTHAGKVLFCAAIGFLVAAGGANRALLAHHSITAEFDLEKRITLAGVITQVEWMNPHSYFFVDVTDARTRKVQNWAFQLNSPNALSGLGWTRASLKAGDVVTAVGSPSVAGFRTVYTREIRFQDGRKLNAELLPSSPSLPR